MTQQRLFEFRMGERSPETLAVTEANRDAANLLTRWQAWPGGALGLSGPQGSGKTHLAMAWAVEAGARQLSPNASPDDAAAVFAESGGRLWIDDADAGDDAMLWRLLDLARAGSGAVLLVGGAPPSQWPALTPDLQSRLAALPVARLGEPDGALLELVLRRVCREKFIHLRDDAVQYLVLRMPRTFRAVRQVADVLDAELVHGAKSVGVKVAKQALERAQGRWGAEED